MTRTAYIPTDAARCLHKLIMYINIMATLSKILSPAKKECTTSLMVHKIKFICGLPVILPKKAL